MSGIPVRSLTGREESKKRLVYRTDEAGQEEPNPDTFYPIKKRTIYFLNLR